MILEQNKSSYICTLDYFEPLPCGILKDTYIQNRLSAFTVIGAIFISFFLGLVYMFIAYRKKVLRRTNIMTLLSILAVYCVLKGLCLILDPYGLKARLSIVLANMIERCTEPVIICAFLVLQNYIICATSIQAKWNKFKTVRQLICLMLIWLFSSLCIELFNVFVLSNYVFRFISKAFVIFLSLYTCANFACIAFNTVLYFDALKSRRHPESKDSVCENSSYYDSDSMTSFKMKHTQHTFGSKDEYLNETSTFLRNFKATSPSQYSRSCNENSIIVEDMQSDLSNIGNDVGNESSSIPSVYDIERDGNERNDRLTSTACAKVTDNNDVDVNNKLDIDDNDQVDKDFIHNEESIPTEIGYLADAEQMSNDTDALSSSICSIRDENSEVWKLAEVNIDSGHNTTKNDIKTCTYSLARVRHCATLRKVLRIGYLITFSLVVDVVLKLYSVCGLYGIFGSKPSLDTRAWFVFQILQRLNTTTSCLLLLIAVFFTLRKRQTGKKRQRFRLSTIITVKS